MHSAQYILLIASSRQKEVTTEGITYGNAKERLQMERLILQLGSFLCWGMEIGLIYTFTFRSLSISLHDLKLTII
ncbi:MAG: hypothetical protein ACREVX_10750 [Clostridium sp.]|uniref:hypothetical protein n=1 Tax=Clostridium sp. TaxID=1506 RepID=UPI003D6C9EF2